MHQFPRRDPLDDVAAVALEDLSWRQLLERRRKLADAVALCDDDRQADYLETLIRETMDEMRERQAGLRKPR
jgi:hypothetical protein